MDLSFYKIRVFRNDFILIPPQQVEGFEPDKLSATAQLLSRRRRGVGASGVVFVERRPGSPTEVCFHDPRGHRRTVNGDVTAAVSRYLFDSGLTDGRSIDLVADGETISVGIVDSHRFRVSLGMPTSGADDDQDPISFSTDANASIVIAGKRYGVTAVRLREHAIVFMPPPVRRGLKEFDRTVRSHEALTDATPLYVRPMSPDSIRLSGWPSPDFADHTSLAGCAAVAAISNGYADGIVSVTYAKEVAFVEWQSADSAVSATVAPDYVFAGEIFVDDEELDSSGPGT